MAEPVVVVVVFVVVVVVVEEEDCRSMELEPKNPASSFAIRHTSS